MLEQQANPYISPTLPAADDASVSVDNPPRSSWRNDIGALNVVGLLLTPLGVAVCAVTASRFFKIFADFKVDLPWITIAFSNKWVIYGLGALFFGWFFLGLVARPKKLSSLIGITGLFGLFLTAMIMVWALFLPLISLINRLSH